MDVWLGRVADGVSVPLTIAKAQQNAIGKAALAKWRWKNAEALRQGESVTLSFVHEGTESKFWVQLKVVNKCCGDMQLTKDDFKTMRERFLEDQSPRALMLESNKGGSRELSPRLAMVY